MSNSKVESYDASFSVRRSQDEGDSKSFSGAIEVGKGVVAEEACLLSECGVVTRNATKALIIPDTVTIDVDAIGSKKISETVKRAYAGAAASSGSVSSACVCVKPTRAK